MALMFKETNTELLLLDMNDNCTGCCAKTKLVLTDFLFQPEVRPNLSGSHTFSLTAAIAETGPLFSFRHARQNVIYKAKRK